MVESEMEDESTVSKEASLAIEDNEEI